MARIGITDVALRDAHQSLFATRMLTADMIPVGGLMDRVGYWSVETWGGATFDTCIRFLNEDPWERLKQLKSIMPHTPQQMLLRGQNLLGYRHYADDVVEAFVARAAHHGVSVFRIFDALNDPRNFATSIRAVKKAGQHAQATISYATSPVHTNEAYVALARELKAMGADSLCIKDMAGLLKPYHGSELVAALKREVGLPVQLHTHSTTGMSVATLVKAIEAGADRVDTAISSLAMGTSHSPTETLVEILRGTEYDTGLDIKLLLEIAACFRNVRHKYRQFESSFLGADTRILTAQVPGGMLSNLENQLREQNALNKLDAVLEEVAVVQRDFGYPPLVTPTSQIVGSQALFNVLFGRYEKLTAESKDLLAGRYGRTPAEPDSKLVKKALDDLKLDVPVTHRPADDIPNELGRIEEELKGKLQVPHVPVEDVLTYAMFPQVALPFFAKRHKGPVTFDAPAPAPAAKAAAPQTAASGRYAVVVNGREYAVKSRPGKDGGRVVEVNGATYEVAVQDAQAPETREAGSKPAGRGADKPETVLAPMPGDIVKLAYEDGDEIEAGGTVLVMEAMKMQLEVKTRRAGTVTFKVSAGTSVKAEQVLAVIE
jgi:oxaloacetate decarboxylase alpha subunit